jgi:hypothetical protein
MFGIILNILHISSHEKFDIRKFTQQYIYSIRHGSTNFYKDGTFADENC